RPTSRSYGRPASRKRFRSRRSPLRSAASTRRSLESDSLEDDHVRAGAGLAQRLALGVFGGGPPGPGVLEARKLEDHGALRRPASFENLGPASAREIPPAVRRDGRR